MTEEQIRELDNDIDFDLLSVRTRRGLQKIGIKTNRQLIETTERELLKCKNFGITSAAECQEYAKAKLGMPIGLPKRSIDFLLAKTNTPPTPTAEREVWEREDCISNVLHQEISTAVFEDGWIEVQCPVMSHRKPDEDTTIHCHTKCAWFRIHNGLAMCGDKIIGKIIEPPKEEE